MIHVGAVGREGVWAVDRLTAAGVDTGQIVTLDHATGHAIIFVDKGAENQIVIHAGANRAVPPGSVARALDRAQAGDWLLTQNETNGGPEAARSARERGLRVAYAAAPFDAEAAAGMLPLADLVVVNEAEARALGAHLGRWPDGVGLLVTRGRGGACYQDASGTVEIPAFRVDPVDTTGAGDCFTGYFLAGLDTGLAPEAALRRAAAAAAISVTRRGAADAIPEGVEVDRFLSDHPA